MLESGFRRFRGAEQRFVLLPAQAVEGLDVLRRKSLLGRQNAGDALGGDADHGVRDLLRHVQLVQADEDGKVLRVGQRLQDAQQLDLALDVQKRRRLVQQDDFRLLADGAGQQDALALAVADAVEVPLRESGSPHQSQRVAHGLPVGLGEEAQPPGVGDAPGCGKLEAGGQLGAAGVGEHEGEPLCAGAAGVGGQILSVQQHCAAHGGQLARQCFEQGGFARAVRPDEGQDLPWSDAQRDMLGQRCFAVADGEVLCLAGKFVHRAPS